MYKNYTSHLGSSGSSPHARPTFFSCVMGRPSARKKHVQKLNSFAKRLGVAALKNDSAGHDAVDKLMVRMRRARTRANDDRKDAKTQAEEVYTLWKATFLTVADAAADTDTVEGTPPPAGGTAEEEKDKEKVDTLDGFRLRGKGFLFNYNWNFFGKPFPDGTPQPSTVTELWQLWKRWKNGKKEERGVKWSSHTMEESLASALKGRVHFHWKVDLHEAIDHSTPRAFAFHGVVPHVRTTFGQAHDVKQARGASYNEARNRGHFYCVVPKIGTLRSGTNYHPFTDYRVGGRWLEDWWADGKLEHGVYADLSLRVRRGHATRKRELEAVMADEYTARVDKQIAAVRVALEPTHAPFKKFAQVTAWEDSFLFLRDRWSVLVLQADSASGKSTYGENLFRNPFCVTVEGAEQLDLRGMDGAVHDGVVLDNVNSWAQLRSWRALLQARNGKSKGGQSATGMYSYTQYLYGMPIVATVDLDAPDPELVDASHPHHSKWLLKNCIIVKLGPGEAYYEKDQIPNVKIENRFSLFAETVRKKRAAEKSPLPIGPAEEPSSKRARLDGLLHSAVGLHEAAHDEEEYEEHIIDPAEEWAAAAASVRQASAIDDPDDCFSWEGEL